MCSFCRSTLVRDGEALRRIGLSAELFDDHSPLQLGATGARQGIAFTLVGRLQYGYEGGTWNEWHALFDNGRSAWLSEDNGAYVISFDAPVPTDAPALDGLQPGMRVLADGRAWDVASVQRAHLIAAQGELPSPPRLQGEFTVVDLRNSAGEVATLDASDPARVAWSVGRAVLLAELALQGLKDISEKTLKGRGVECPNCGTALAVKLATTQSLVCTNCAAVVDISGGIGADLKHYQQNNAGGADGGGAEPLLPLGRSGTLALGGPPLSWQVVGYLERCDIPAPGDDEETSFWREYLLFNTTAGFAFLVDSNDGWSWVRPITGAPALRGGQATWENVVYRQKWEYDAKVTWVQGEFYWRIERDERARVTDFEGTGSAAAKRLSREKARSEVTWSAGETLDATAVADAFAIAPDARGALQRDVAPTSFKAAGVPKALLIFVVVLVVVMLLSMCSDDECDKIKSTFGAASAEYQQCARNRGSGTSGRVGGGSYGGWSSGGGGHK